MMKYCFLILLLVIAFRPGYAKNGSVKGNDSRVNFFINVENEKTNLKIFSFFVLPGEKLPLSVTGDQNISAKNKDGFLKETSNGKWIFRAPNHTGIYDIIFTGARSGDKMLFHVFVMVPFHELKNGYLNGYRIGRYPEKKYKDYKNPKGFVEVTAKNQDVNITPHFKLKQFLCKESGKWPKYVVINPRMVRKLELMLDKLNEESVHAKTFFLMSAYRTPFYNKSIGNVKYSRHVFGDAIDLYVDDNKDGKMDDLNRDGKINIKDARVIAKVVEEIEHDPKYKEFIGGMGVYKRNSRHTYFVHVDTRGYRARW